MTWENYDTYYTERYIRRGTHRSTHQLEDAIRHYVKVNNTDPKPFIWAKTADDTIAQRRGLQVLP